MPNFSVKYTILEKNLEEMTPEIMKIFSQLFQFDKSREAAERNLCKVLKDWQEKNTSLYDTGEF